jgi:iron complex outermembrane recepter protein
LAVRASGFTRRDPGYVDDPVLGIDGVNRLDVSGGRLSALWRPTENLSLKLSALMQESERQGSPDVYAESTLGDLQQNNLRGTGIYDRKLEAYSAAITARLGAADITSLTGYNINTVFDWIDFPSRIPAAQRLFNVSGAATYDDTKASKFTQELRLSFPVGPRVDWLLGGFYTEEDTRNLQGIDAVDPTTGASVGTLVLVPFPNTFSEYAAFTNLTFHITDRFDVQVGARESRTRHALDQTVSGAQVGTPIVSPRARSKASAFTYLLTPQFKVSPDLMMYARIASGYRAGAPNINAEPLGLPRQYDPDKTQNYEIGVKGDLLADALSFDASVYYIDWQDIQLLLQQNGFGFRDNGNRAKSQGVELSLEAHPLRGLSIATWVAWNDAKLTENFPTASQVFGREGDRLPQSSRFSGNLAVDQDLALANGMAAFIGASVSYVGERLGDFRTTSTLARQRFPAYAQIDVRAGVNHGPWAVNLFLNNVADRRGIFTGSQIGTLSLVNYIQPRTAGLSVERTF